VVVRAMNGDCDDFYGVMEGFAAETETAEPETIPAPSETPAAPGETKTGKDETPSALDDARDAAEPKDELTGGAKPPEDGLCRECKRRRRLNRLKLCYPCFAELVLAEEAKKRGHAWKPGDRHPDWCGCEGLGEHPERDRGAWRGN
jgi:hypothetical protein